MFHSLIIKAIKKETSDAVSIEFDLPSNLKNDFQFKSGQFLTLKATINGEDVRRSYSLCSTPASETLKVVVKQIPNGVFSNFANTELKVGDAVEVGAPSGTFYIETGADNSKTYCLVAAGSGITPMISIAKTVLLEEPSSKVILFYGNKSPEQTIFKKELDELSSSSNGRLHTHFIYSAAKGEDRFHTGRIEGRKIKKIFKKYANVKEISDVFICGPQAMTDNIKAALVNDFNFPASNVHFELFVATSGDSTVKTDGPSIVKATLDGRTIEFSVKADETILDAGLRNGYDIPFSCQGGVCGACRCAKGTGDLEMENCIALTDDEISSGIYLTCQSKVKSQTAEITFDL